MNPYASKLGDRDAVQTIATTPPALRALVDASGPEAVNRPPAPGKWSVREILCHLADCEITFAYRLRQALAEQHHRIQPFDQDAWSAVYAAYDAPTALAAFTAARNWNLAFIKALPAAALDKPLTHPERGDMVIRTIIETMGGHDVNHLRQIEAMLSA